MNLKIDRSKNKNADVPYNSYLLIGLIISVVILTGFSVDSLSVSVTPLLLDLNIKPGGEGSGKITVLNNEKSPVSIEAQVRGFITSEKGTAHFLKPSKAEDYRYSGEELLAIEPKEAVLGPGKSMDFTYKVTYPKDITPFGGRYVAALFQASPIGDDSEESSGSSIKVALRGGTLMLIRPSEEIIIGKEFREYEVKPQIKKLSAKLVYDGSMLVVSTILKNSGNIHVRKEEFEGSIRISDSSGEVLKELKIRPHYILPGTEYDLTELWELPKEIKGKPEKTYSIEVRAKVKTPYGEVVEIKDSTEIDI